MRFLENVHTEYTLPVEGGEDRHFVIDLKAIAGERIKGDVLFGIPTKYPYSLSIEERVKSTTLIDRRFYNEYTYIPVVSGIGYIPVVSGIAYISLDELKELKKDPYKFCIENGIIESDEETESDNDETSAEGEGE
ncbi:MAG: hypothetical protein IKU29_04120 [Parabacteroides sp.]|nr:hypothetical protein [Parabacteroides sp.]